MRILVRLLAGAILVLGLTSFVVPLAIDGASAQERSSSSEAFAPAAPEKTADDRIADYTLALTIATGLMFIANVALAFLTFKLWQEAKKSAELTRNATVVDNRAFVFATGYAPIWEIDPTGNVAFRFLPQWKNSGATPTRQLRLYAWSHVTNAELPVNHDFTIEQVPQTLGFIGPHSEAGGLLVPPPPSFHPISLQDIIDVQGGTKFLYLWGSARYHDAFEGTPERITRFAWRIIPVGVAQNYNPFTDPAALQFHWVQLQRGNCTDEECAIQ